MGIATLWARRRTGLVAAAAAVALLGALAAPAGADTESGAKADGLISKNGSTYIGNNVYNGGAGQAHTRTVARGATGLFYIQLQNDSAPPSSQEMGLVGCPGNSNFRVRYFAVIQNAPPFDVTASVVAGNRGQLSAGGTATFLVEVKVKAIAPAGAAFSCKVRVIEGPNNAVAVDDNVKFTVNRA